MQRKITSFSGDVSFSQIVVAADVSGSMMEVLEPLRAALFDFADLVGGASNEVSGDVLLTRSRSVRPPECWSTGRRSKGVQERCDPVTPQRINGVDRCDPFNRSESVR